MSRETIRQLSYGLGSKLRMYEPDADTAAGNGRTFVQPEQGGKVDLKTLALNVIANEHKMGKSGVTDDKLIVFPPRESSTKMVCVDAEVNEIATYIHDNDVEPDGSCLVVKCELNMRRSTFGPGSLSMNQTTVDVPGGDIIFGVILQHPKLFIAGGYVSAMITKTIYDDVDVFMVGVRDHIEATDIINNIRGQISKMHTDDNVKMFTTRLATTFAGKRGHRTWKIQIVHRLYSSRAEVLYGFDLGSSAAGILVDGNVLMTPSGLLAIKHGLNVPDLRKRRSTLERRLEKYFMRGYNIILPHANMDAFVTDGDDRNGEEDRYPAHSWDQCREDWASANTGEILVNMKFWSFRKCQKISKSGTINLYEIRRISRDNTHTDGGLYSDTSFSYDNHNKITVRNLEELSKDVPRGGRIVLCDSIGGGERFDLFLGTIATNMFNNNRRFFAALEKFIGTEATDVIYTYVRKMKTFDNIKRYVTDNLFDIIKELDAMLDALVPSTFVDNKTDTCLGDACLGDTRQNDTRQNDTCLTGGGSQFPMNVMTEREWYGDLYQE